MTNCFEKKKYIYLLGLAFFFIFVHYHGYILDAALYLLQAVNFLYPERFVNDVPFMFGNQDSFTIYSPIIAKIFELFNVDFGGRLITFILQFAWGLGAICLVERWCAHFNLKKWSLPVFGVFMLVLSTKKYGCGFNEFPIIDPLLVARFFSEIFALFALAFFFHRNKYISLILFLLATSLHPLMCGWGLPLWLFYNFPKTRIPFVVAALLFPLTAFFHIDRFDIYPSDWLAKPYCFTPNWHSTLVYSGYLLFWLAMWRYQKQTCLSKFSISLFFVAAIAFYFQYVASFAGHIFLFQVQPYRVQWLCAIPIISTFAVYIKGLVFYQEKIALKEYACVALGLCALSQNHWTVLLLILSLAIFAPIKLFEKEVFNFKWSKPIFLLSLAFFVIVACISNFVEMSLQQAIGGTSYALKMMDLPETLLPIRNALLLLLTLICFSEGRFGFALAFALSFCNAKFQILPLATSFLYLIPTLNESLKRLIFTLVAVLSFVEILDSLEKSPTWSLVFIGALFVLTFLSLGAKKESYFKTMSAISILTFVLFICWDIHVWDARDEAFAQREKQMEAFLETPIFSQVQNRGQLLFVVDNEAPTQSRFNFLTGAYADASIYVGEIFYKGQYQESNRRRSALLTGGPDPAFLGNFEDQMMDVYSDHGTLLQRVNYLCSTGEISHLATDIHDMKLPKIDSTFLEVREKFVYLYQCN